MQTMKNRIRSEQSGFTLVELMATMSVMIIVMIASLGILDIAVRSEPEIADRNRQVQAAQTELERLTREIRVSYEVVAASPTSLTVLTYVNRTACNGGAPDTTIRCRVTYSCASGNCTRTISEADGSSPTSPTTVVSGLSSDSIFAYTPDAVDPVTVDITLNYPAGQGGGEDAITVTDGVVMRNLPPPEEEEA